ncbi:MAG: hypothetical protein B6I31_03710 [Desulfobacteraceae bacterium 4572_19]|nr:MAG: hypothetical protein B6I31_03710 [Desulfobacteraceae bacterium 4572_19]
MKKKLQVKICGLTKVDEALSCVQLGADAIGLVFYHRSPRNVSEKKAKIIADALPDNVASVGVFVDETLDFILNKVEKCGLTAVQLHGNEPALMVKKLMDRNIKVFKALFLKKEPMLHMAKLYNPSAFLLECGSGKLPGGNARQWDWSKAGDLDTTHPVILAGGLSPDNIAKAIHLCKFDAVDISSGVELAPGRKDPVNF